MRRWSILIACTVGCGSDPTSNLAFVTSSVHDGNLGGTAGADAVCAQRASEAGHAGTFVAWVSTSSASAFSRLALARSWTLVDGTPIADTPSDFTTLSVRNPIYLDEHGEDVRSTQAGIWTGTNSDGSPSANLNCEGWTSNVSTVNGTFGDVRGGSWDFTSTGMTSCSTSRRLLCLGTDRSAPLVTQRASGRYAFVSAESFLPNPLGVASADQMCNDEAHQAGLDGTYRALLPQQGTPAASRFDLTGAAWIRVDGTALTVGARELFTRDFLLTFLDQTASGTLVTPGAHHWAGDPMSPTAESCTNWTSTDGAALWGRATWTDRGRFYNDGRPGCGTTGVHVICLQD